MSDYRIGDSSGIEVRIRRSAQARRMTLRVSALDGRVTLSMPRYATDRQAQKFLREHEAWLKSRVAAHSPQDRPEFGGTIMLEGQDLPILPTEAPAPHSDGRAVFVPGPGEAVPVRLAAYLKVLARDRLVAACDNYSARAGRAYSAISLRDTRSRWGSCSSTGRLMFSWRLIMAPRDVLSYVAAHEVAHLVEMNHSPAYWSVLEGLFPNHAGPRAWLRANGARLHAFRFGD